MILCAFLPHSATYSTAILQSCSKNIFFGITAPRLKALKSSSWAATRALHSHRQINRHHEPLDITTLFNPLVPNFVPFESISGPLRLCDEHHTTKPICYQCSSSTVLGANLVPHNHLRTHRFATLLAVSCMRDSFPHL